jgi:CHAT domain-containing protein
VSAKLYDWLIRPLEKEIDTGKINNLVFALDRFLRYIPMSALFDSQAGKYLIQKGYQVSTIISASKTNVGDRLAAKDINVLAMGLTKPKPPFLALTNVEQELTSIVKGQKNKNSAGIFPGKVLYDNDFSLENLQRYVEKYRILHLATHGEFVPGNEDDSYLVLGTGDNTRIDKLTPTKIKRLSNELTNVHLVVLSACQTALGGSISQVDQRGKAEGVEIPGLSYSFMRDDRAKAVLASLWAVNDFSTAKLMQAFYTNLANTKEPMTKAEALRRAQLSLLEGSATKVKAESDRGNFNIQLAPGSNANSIDLDFSHPYFWAPFILIGNGL